MVRTIVDLDLAVGLLIGLTLGWIIGRFGRRR